MNDVIIQTPVVETVLTIGKYSILKNCDTGLYYVMKKKEFVFEELGSFSSSISLILLDYLSDTEGINEVIYYDNIYIKKYNDMHFYKNAKKWDLYHNAKYDAYRSLKAIQNYIKR